MPVFIHGGGGGADPIIWVNETDKIQIGTGTKDIVIPGDLAVTGHLTKGGVSVSTQRRISLRIGANGGNGTVTYLSGSDYVASIASISEGLAINLQNVPSGASVSASWSFSSSFGLGSTVPFIYVRALSEGALYLGIKSAPGTAGIPFSNYTIGELLVNIFID